MSIKIEISVGELLDKITILEIKSERIEDKAKLININKEKAVLSTIWASVANNDLVKETEELKTVNESLWEIEDAIRDKERTKQFDEEFIELARAVYITNDKRASIKKVINEKTGSDLIEEKSYQEY
ncbi:MAG: DUF6165 family protein [Pseudomonadota bacterium]